MPSMLLGCECDQAKRLGRDMEVCEVQTVEARKATAVMSDREWMAANKHVLRPEMLRKTWYDNHGGERHDNANNPQQELTPERELWAAVFRQAIDEADGKQRFHRSRCYDCTTRHTIQECAKQW